MNDSGDMLYEQKEDAWWSSRRSFTVRARVKQVKPVKPETHQRIYPCFCCIQPLVVLQIFRGHGIISLEAMHMDPETFGPSLKEARLRSEMTQEQLAQRLHVSSAAVSKWERGHPSSSGSSPKPAVSGSFFCKKCKTVTRTNEVSVHGYLV